MLNSKWDDRPAEYAILRDCWLNRRRANFIKAFLEPARSGDRVLEVGSGVGGLLTELALWRPDLHFLGIEPQASYVEFSKKRAIDQGIANLEFQVALVERASEVAGQNRFDWILSNDVLHHLADTPRALQTLRAISSPDAKWLAIEPNCRNPYVMLRSAMKTGERNFWPRLFAQDAKKCGWWVDSKSYLFLVPPFVRSPSLALRRIESALETNSILAGGVALVLDGRQK